MDKSNITGLVDKMESLNIIERQKVKSDRRSYHIVLTSEGKKLIDKIDRLYEKKVKEIMTFLSDKEYDALIQLMKKLRKGILQETNE